MPRMQPPDWREGYKLTGADLDGALDDAAAATTGIDRDQLADDARFDLAQFAEQGCEGTLQFILPPDTAAGFPGNNSFTVIEVAKGGGTIEDVSANAAGTSFTKNGVVVVAPFDVEDTDEVVLWSTASVTLRGSVRCTWRQQR